MYISIYIIYIYIYIYIHRLGRAAAGRAAVQKFGQPVLC